MENKIAEQVNEAINELELLNLEEITLGFSDGPFEQWDYRKQQRYHFLREDCSIMAKYGLEMMKLFKEAIEGETDLEDFENKVNEFFGTKPHQILLVNKKVYKKNTMHLTCGGEQCKNCFNQFTCDFVGKRRIITMIDIQPEFIRVKLKSENDGTFGSTPDKIVRKKQNDHTQIFLGKLMYVAVNSAYKLNGFGGVR